MRAFISIFAAFIWTLTIPGVIFYWGQSNWLNWVLAFAISCCVLGWLFAHDDQTSDFEDAQKLYRKWKEKNHG